MGSPPAAAAAPPRPVLLPLVDALLVTAVVAAAAWAATAGWPLAAAALACAAAALAWVSTGIAVWRYGPPPPPSTGTRKLGSELRPPYPDGWFALAPSVEVPPGGVVSANVGGLDFVVWRPRSGGPAVVSDAHCPHLGAHLGVGGAVGADDCLACPFHGWRFRASGELAVVPGCAAGETVPPPPGGGLRVWPSTEQNGVISVWVSSRQHAAGQAAPPPPHGGPWFHVPAIPEASGGGGGGGWTLHGWTEHAVPTVIYDIPENGADVAHLPALHGSFLLPSLGGLLSHWWAASWEPRPRGAGAPGGGPPPGAPPPENNPAPGGAGPFVDIVIQEAITWGAGAGGAAVPGTRVHVDITQAGPSQVLLRMRAAGGRLPLLVVETVTPVAPATQRVLHLLFAPAWVPRCVGKLVLAATVSQFARDVPIWAAKRYLPRPVLSRADRGIPAYRRWVAQFYGPGSLAFEDAAAAHLCDAAGLAPRGAAAAAVLAAGDGGREGEGEGGGGGRAGGPAATCKAKEW